jgi:hypothetical protein
MRIALCFYGLVGSKADKNGNGVALEPQIAYDLNNKNLMKHNIELGNEVDVFIHSWSHEFKNELVSLYEPKAFEIEKQRDFAYSNNIAHNRDFSELVKMSISALKAPSSLFELLSNNRKEAFRAYSRWYSNKVVLGLKSKYEQENNFEYDCVMVLRLDVGFYTPLDYSAYDMESFYASNWNDYPTAENDYIANDKNHNLEKGFLDFWFFSNSENMNKFSALYESITNYHVCPHRAAYQHVSSFTDKIKYIKYRWSDFEMIRRKEFDSLK